MYHRAEHVVQELEALDRGVSELRRQSETVAEEATRLDDETTALTEALHRLRQTSNTVSMEELHALSPMDWDDFKDIPAYPVGTPTEESFRSAAEMDVDNAPSDQSTAHTLPFQPIDCHQDVKSDAPGEMKDITSVGRNFTCGPVDDVGGTQIPQEVVMSCHTEPVVHEGMMEMLRMMDRNRRRLDVELSQFYSKNKVGRTVGETSESDVTSRMDFRFPLTEHEEWKMLVGLWGEEELHDMWQHIPDQQLSPIPKRFIDRSRLIEDPVGDAMESYEAKPWSSEEQKIFLEKFVRHPKDFYEIAKWLPNRSTGDCVQFFYANRKTELFGAIRRKQQLKKRRLQSESNKQAMSHLLMTTRRSGLESKLHGDRQRLKEVVTWFKDRMHDMDITFTNQDLATAVQKFGFNYKALAHELCCTRPSVVGVHLLVNWRRMGLQAYFGTSDPSVSTPTPGRLHLHRTISAPERMIEGRSGSNNQGLKLGSWIPEEEAVMDVGIPSDVRMTRSREAARIASLSVPSMYSEFKRRGRSLLAEPPMRFRPTMGCTAPWNDVTSSMVSPYSPSQNKARRSSPILEGQSEERVDSPEHSSSDRETLKRKRD